jgi:hypothetical protein
VFLFTSYFLLLPLNVAVVGDVASWQLRVEHFGTLNKGNFRR